MTEIEDRSGIPAGAHQAEGLEVRIARERLGPVAGRPHGFREVTQQLELADVL